jgi:hypothetical protein
VAIEVEPTARPLMPLRWIASLLLLFWVIVGIWIDAALVCSLA